MLPTPHSEINLLLDALQSNVRTILAGQFVGMYLYGSLATGDFDLDHSDIDFVVVTNAALSEEVSRALEVMHEKLKAAGGKWAHKLEGAYIPQQEIRRHLHSDSLYLWVNEGKFFRAPLHSDWIFQRHVLREHGVVLAGPSPQALIDPVSMDELRRATVGILDEWWRPILDRPSELLREGYQPFAILTMCRALYTLQHGTLASKPASARWAIAMLDERWKPLIEWALNYGEPSEQTLRDTVDFIQYTAEQSRKKTIDSPQQPRSAN